MDGYHNCMTYAGQYHDTSLCSPCTRKGKLNDFKNVRSSVVHINTPLFETDEYYNEFYTKGKTFLSSVMPLGLFTKNKYFVSGDFHVKESRKTFESTSDQNQWNGAVAASIFELIKNNFIEVEKFLTKLETKGEFTTINLTPTSFDSMFDGSISRLEEKLDDGSWNLAQQNFVHSVWEKKWIFCTNGVFSRPKNVIVPFDRKNNYDEKLCETLELLGLDVGKACMTISLQRKIK